MLAKSKLTKIERIVTDLVPVGLYLVTFDRVWGNHCNSGEHDDCMDHGCFDNGREYIAEIDPITVRVTKDNYLTLTENVINRDDAWNGERLFEGDTHDLRPRLFKSLKDAREHVKYTVDRFTNPQPWECFVKTA